MLKKLFGYNESYLTILILLLGAGITIANPSFLTFENVFGFLKSYSMAGIMAVGTLFVLIMGGTDVSFTAIAQVVEYAVAVVTLAWGGNIYLALLAAAVMGAIMGLVNGLIVHYFRVPVIIVTIATLNIFFGMLYVITQGRLINDIHPMFKQFGNLLLFPARSAAGGTYGLSLMPLLWMAALLLGWFILRRTFLGRSVFAIGGNEVAAERVGINALWVRLFVFGFVGLLSGVAAVVHLSIVQSVVPNIIVGKELEVIAAVVIGGASVFGGKGTVYGTFLGVLLFAMLNNGLTLLSISSYWYNVTIGVVITAAISISALQKLRQQRRRVNVSIGA
jgi:simple sugar transport system permease protein